MGAIQLTRQDLFPDKYRKPARIVAEDLIEENENPDEFYATVEPARSSNGLIFHLWHQDAFKEENKGVIGNPGGKCRDVYYDIKQQRARELGLWQ